MRGTLALFPVLQPAPVSPTERFLFRKVSISNFHFVLKRKTTEKWYIERLLSQGVVIPKCTFPTGHYSGRSFFSKSHYSQILNIKTRPFGITTFRNNSSAECKKVVSDIFDEIDFLMEYENIGLYAHFALFSKFLALLFSKILSKMCLKKCHLRPYCTNIWHMCLMQEGRKCHLRPSCTNFWQMCLLQERHKCHLRPSCTKQLISLNSPCFGFIPTFQTKNIFIWNMETN